MNDIRKNQLLTKYTEFLDKHLPCKYKILTNKDYSKVYADNNKIEIYRFNTGQEPRMQELTLRDELLPSLVFYDDPLQETSLSYSNITLRKDEKNFSPLGREQFKALANPLSFIKIYKRVSIIQSFDGYNAYDRVILELIDPPENIGFIAYTDKNIMSSDTIGTFKDFMEEL